MDGLLMEGLLIADAADHPLILSSCHRCQGCSRVPWQRANIKVVWYRKSPPIEIGVCYAKPARSRLGG